MCDVYWDTGHGIRLRKKICKFVLVSWACLIVFTYIRRVYILRLRYSSSVCHSFETLGSVVMKSLNIESVFGKSPATRVRRLIWLLRVSLALHVLTRLRLCLGRLKTSRPSGIASASRRLVRVRSVCTDRQGHRVSLLGVEACKHCRPRVCRARLKSRLGQRTLGTG